jgi:hypothetical protein
VAAQPPTRRDPPTPDDAAAGLGAATLAQLVAAGAAVGPAAVGAVGKGAAVGAASLPHGTARAAAEAIERALDGFWMQQLAIARRKARARLGEALPHWTPSMLDRAVAEELRYEQEFKRKSRARWARDLPAALGNPDPEARRKALTALLDRERRYAEQRYAAIVRRVEARVERERVREASPLGAYWTMDPRLKTHTPGCVALAGHFWPWAVIDRVHPPVHASCGCRLWGLDDAIARGWMRADQVPDPADALLRARLLARRIEELHGELGEAELREALVAGVDGRHYDLRYPRGTTKGGEYRPRRGGDPGRKLRRDLRRLIEPPPHASLREMREPVRVDGRTVMVPWDKLWRGKVGEKRYYSPPQSTNVYEAHEPVPRAAGPGLIEKLRERASEVVGGKRAEQLDDMRARLAAGQGPVMPGEGIGMLGLLPLLGYRRTATSQTSAEGRPAVEDRWRDGEGNIVTVTRGNAPDGYTDVVGSRVERARTPTARLLDRPPKDFDEFKADTVAWAQQMAKRHRRALGLTDVREDNSLSDSSAYRDWDGVVNFGPDVRAAVEVGAVMRKEGPLTGEAALSMMIAQQVAMHEASHAIDTEYEYRFRAPGRRNLEEALTEEVGLLEGARRLRDTGQGDVLQWAADHPDHWQLKGNYRDERLALATALDHAGVAPEDRNAYVYDLKYEADPEQRLPRLARDAANHNGTGYDDELATVTALMDDPTNSPLSAAWTALPALPPEAAELRREGPTVPIGDGPPLRVGATVSYRKPVPGYGAMEMATGTDGRVVSLDRNDDGTWDAQLDAGGDTAFVHGIREGEGLDGLTVVPGGTVKGIPEGARVAWTRPDGKETEGTLDRVLTAQPLGGWAFEAVTADGRRAVVTSTSTRGLRRAGEASPGRAPRSWRAYHGTSADAAAAIGSSGFTAGADGEVWLTQNRGEARGYGPEVVPVTVTARNPYIARMDRAPGENLSWKAARDAGHDAYVIEDAPGGATIISFDPSQVSRREESPGRAGMADTGPEHSDLGWFAGSWGKGWLFGNGRVVTWETPEMGGAPHHDDKMEELVRQGKLPPGADAGEWDGYATPLVIDPDGGVALGFGGFGMLGEVGERPSPEQMSQLRAADGSLRRPANTSPISWPGLERSPGRHKGEGTATDRGDVERSPGRNPAVSIDQAQRWLNEPPRGAGHKERPITKPLPGEPQPWEQTAEEFAASPATWWHGTEWPTMGEGDPGLVHLGDWQTAHDALKARTGQTRAGLSFVPDHKRIAPPRRVWRDRRSGAVGDFFGPGGSPSPGYEDRYERVDNPLYREPFEAHPRMVPVRIEGPMADRVRVDTVGDTHRGRMPAESILRGQLKRGATPRLGYFYRNEGEGSYHTTDAEAAALPSSAHLPFAGPSGYLTYPISAVVPSPDWLRSHEDYVRQALADGKPVPARVLAEYPELRREASPGRAGITWFPGGPGKGWVWADGTVTAWPVGPHGVPHHVDHMPRLYGPDGQRAKPDYLADQQRYEDLRAEGAVPFVLSEDGVARLSPSGDTPPPDVMRALRAALGSEVRAPRWSEEYSPGRVPDSGVPERSVNNWYPGSPGKAWVWPDEGRVVAWSTDSYGNPEHARVGLDGQRLPGSSRASATTEPDAVDRMMALMDSGAVAVTIDPDGQAHDAYVAEERDAPAPDVMRALRAVMGSEVSARQGRDEGLRGIGEESPGRVTDPRQRFIDAERARLRARPETAEDRIGRAAHAERLSEAERGALLAYTENPRKMTDAQRSALRALVERHPLPEPVAAYRKAARGELDGVRPGDRLAEDRFLSVSVGPTYGIGEGHGSMRVELPAGTPAYYNPDNDSEHELILPPGLRLRVDSADASGGKPRVSATATPPALINAAIGAGVHAETQDALYAGRPLTPEQDAHARQLDAAIAGQPPLEGPVTVWRGQAEPFAEGPTPAFLSTSTDPDVADAYGDTRSADHPVARIHVPAGTRAADMTKIDDPEGYSGMSDELLLPRGTALRRRPDGDWDAVPPGLAQPVRMTVRAPAASPGRAAPGDPPRRTGDAKLDAAIEEFMRSRFQSPDTYEEDLDAYREPENAWGSCEIVARAFAAFLKERGFNAYATSDDLRAFPGYEGAKRSEDVGAGEFTYPEHSVVEVYDLPGRGVNTVTIDFTAAQYGFSDFPKVEPPPPERSPGRALDRAERDLWRARHGRGDPAEAQAAVDAARARTPEMSPGRAAGVPEQVDRAFLASVEGEHRLRDGRVLRTVIEEDGVYRDHGALTVEGYIEDPGARPDLAGPHAMPGGVGVFRRSLSPDGRGGYVVRKDMLWLDPAYRRQGFAADLDRTSEEAWGRIGVRRIELTTDDDGGYVWARLGYRLDVDRYMAEGGITPEELALDTPGFGLPPVSPPGTPGHAADVERRRDELRRAYLYNVLEAAEHDDARSAELEGDRELRPSPTPERLREVLDMVIAGELRDVGDVAALPDGRALLSDTMWEGYRDIGPSHPPNAAAAEPDGERSPGRVAAAPRLRPEFVEMVRRQREEDAQGLAVMANPRKWAHDRGMTDREYADAVAKHVGGLAREADLVVRIDQEYLGRFLRGHIANQHESGHSDGLYNPVFRANVEAAAWAIPGAPMPSDPDSRDYRTDQGDAIAAAAREHPERYPVYGYFSQGEDLPTPPGEGMYSSRSNNATQYGGVKLVLKPGVKERTYLFLGDSLAPIRDRVGAPSPALRPSPLSAQDDPLDYRELGPDGDATPWPYTEAEIFGGVRPEDVDHAELASAPEGDLLAAFAKSRVPWTVGQAGPRNRPQVSGDPRAGQGAGLDRQGPHAGRAARPGDAGEELAGREPAHVRRAQARVRAHAAGLLVSTGQPDMERYASPALGRLLVPGSYGQSDEDAAEGVPFAADNGGFWGVPEGDYKRMAEELSRGRKKPLWVTVPGRVPAPVPDPLRQADMGAQPEGRRARGRGQGEGGQEDAAARGRRRDDRALRAVVAVPQARGAARRVRGPGRHGLARAAGLARQALGRHLRRVHRRVGRLQAGAGRGELAKRAHDHGKLVHVGRVNTHMRIAYARDVLRADSIDGGTFSKFKDTYLPSGLAYIPTGGPPPTKIGQEWVRSAAEAQRGEHAWPRPPGRDKPQWPRGFFPTPAEASPGRAMPDEWMPGSWGKGHVSPGGVVTWSTDEAGFPEHSGVTPDDGTDFIITPDGAVWSDEFAQYGQGDGRLPGELMRRVRAHDSALRAPRRSEVLEAAGRGTSATRTSPTRSTPPA